MFPTNSKLSNRKPINPRKQITFVHQLSKAAHRRNPPHQADKRGAPAKKKPFVRGRRSQNRKIPKSKSPSDRRNAVKIDAAPRSGTVARPTGRLVRSVGRCRCRYVAPATRRRGGGGGARAPAPFFEHTGTLPTAQNVPRPPRSVRIRTRTGRFRFWFFFLFLFSFTY